MEPSYTYKAEVTRVIDGDHLEMVVDLGFNVHVAVRVHIRGCRAPKDATGRLVRAKAFIYNWLDEAAGESCADRAPVFVRSYKVDDDEWEVDVYKPAHDGIKPCSRCLGLDLVAQGHAERVDC